MPSEVRHRVDSGLTYPVVRLTGVLDADSVPAVRSALLDVLAEQPEALVVDVRELSLGAPEAAAVLRDVARAGAEWPAAPLAVCAAGDARAWHGVGLPIWPTLEEAFAALGEPSPDHFLNTPLQPIVGAARRSREVVTEACGRWDVPELAGPACIVITEMVNNVVAHARTDMVVLLGLHGGTMTVAVRDRSSDVPRFSGEPVPVTSYGGRGLLLIDSVASSWGCLPVTDGKVVWAALTGEEEPAGDLRGTGMAGRSRG